MSKFVSYGSIEQYRSVVRNVQSWFEHNNKPKGKLSFHGTVKLHGTNAGIGYDPATGEIWAQSRSNIITPESDNAGFATWVHANRELITKFMKRVNDFTDGKSIKLVFGEWCGGNIQKGVAINGLPKMFVMFDIKVTYDDENDNRYENHQNVGSIYNIERAQLERINFFCAEFFPTWDMDIDFSYPEASVQPLIDITMAVETECPVAKHFGNVGVGEGVVWKCADMPNIRFKSKGEKHSESKVKTIVAVDIDKVNSIREFVAYAFTDYRMNKVIDKMKEEGTTIEPKNTGVFLKAIMADVLKEETDTFVDNGLEWKEIAGQASKHARDFWLAKCGAFE